MAAGIPEYDDLKVRIEPDAEQSYRVLVFGPEGATASGSFASPFSAVELDNFVLRVGLPRRSVRSFRSSQMEDAKAFGSRLFDALVRDDVREAYIAAREAANARERGLRVTLQLTNAPELMEIPWEFLYERPRFLAQSIYTPLVRSLDLKTVRPAPRLALPLRILGVVSSPKGVLALDVGEERRKLEQALSELIATGQVELNWLERATLRELNRVVAAPDELHVIHYIGHGAYDDRAQGGMLVLETAGGDPHEVTGEDLSSLLGDERSLGLAVLNCCEGARTSHVDPFSGVASSLVECGIPAVIGMQFEVTDEAAIAFAEALYSGLAQGFPVDAALAQARRAIFAAGNDTEFGTPVLFLRSGATRLFEIDPTAPRAVANKPPRPREAAKPPPAKPPPAKPPPAKPPPAKPAARAELVPVPKETAPSPPPKKKPKRLPVIPADQVPARLNAWERLYLRKALKKFPGWLHSRETIHAVAAGSYESMMGTDGLILLTDLRLLFVTSRDDRDLEIALRDIGSITRASAAMDTSKLTVTHGKNAAIIAGMDKSAAEELEKLLHLAMGR